MLHKYTYYVESENRVQKNNMYCGWSMMYSDKLLFMKGREF